MIAFNLNCLLFDERTVLVVLYKDTQGGITMSMKNRPSKPWYKVWWVWLIIVVVVFSVIGVSGENSGSSSSSSDSSSTQTHSTPKKESSQKASASVSSESITPTCVGREYTKQTLIHSHSQIRKCSFFISFYFGLPFF